MKILLLSKTICYLTFISSYCACGAHNMEIDTTFIESACVSESLIISEDESATVSAYLFPAIKKKITYIWEVDEGEIIGSGQQIKWKASNARLGPHEIRLTIRYKGIVKKCSTIVYVGLSEIGLKMSKTTNGASFLLPSEKESNGYGLYSYLILVKALDDQLREQQIAAIMQIMSMPSAKELEKVMNSKKKINITYLPITKNPPPSIFNKLSSKSGFRNAAEWVLQNYDYARAAAQLTIIPEEIGKGTMFYCALNPLIPSDKILNENHLWINLSEILAPEDVELWVKEFIIQSQQDHFWEPRTMSMIGLKLRLILGAMGYELPKVVKALKWLTKDNNLEEKG